MPSEGYRTELVWLLGFIGAVGFLGYFFEQTLLALLIATSLYCARIVYQTHRLARWVYHARRSTAADDSLASIWSDIAEDVRFLQLRHEREKQRLQAVVVRVQEMTTALTDGVILIDKRDNVEWWNQAAGHLFGFKEVDQGHKLTNIIRTPKFVHYFDRRDYQQPLELNSFRKEDQQLQVQVHPFGQGERLVVARDITRLFKLEQMRKDFIANLSHELRTPLTVIKGYLETLADSEQMPKNWRQPFSQMSQQASRMNGLIQDLITLSKLETQEREPQRKPVELGPLLASVVDDAKALSTAHGHSFIVQGDLNARLLGNSDELRSAFANLVVNAVNYSPDGGKIIVSVQRSAGGLEVSVKDNGVGIDPKHIPRLTERFYRVDPSRSVLTGGTGLGLAIVKHILLPHDAQLRINSMPGKGSTFYCEFPPEAVA
ncbi:MAG TPA: phosphate regulon sensor histidine kinase PhoR [Cellvibrionaceae bacterium]|nr:phosphate regulon sensor histidine kinase PhoR [Cellvibrionaceae bacterium]